jgi:hypothetical protein
VQYVDGFMRAQFWQTINGNPIPIIEQLLPVQGEPASDQTCAAK